MAMAVPLVVENSFGTAFLRDTDTSQCRQSSVPEAVTTGISRNRGGTRSHGTSTVRSVDCVHSAQVARSQRSETGGTPGWTSELAPHSLHAAVSCSTGMKWGSAYLFYSVQEETAHLFRCL